MIKHTYTLKIVKTNPLKILFADVNTFDLMPAFSFYVCEGLVVILAARNSNFNLILALCIEKTYENSNVIIVWSPGF